ncbi:CLIP-associated protein [Vitis vinifera]|uniref:CLIP-associated protein n=1 Tax=Vitis vinifera TaxID=29760 RepID=A0A438KD75_VITVI|nr:CLIP-associated protein [Vitis vinifera]
MHQGSFHSPLIAANSSHNSLLSLPLLGPYNPEKTHTKPSSQFLKRQEIEKDPTSNSNPSKTLLSHITSTPRSFANSLNTTFLVLIPKKGGAEDLGDFRPINLLGGLYKLLAKVLANRLKKVEKVVSMDQNAFVRGRQILDASLIANEASSRTPRGCDKEILFLLISSSWGGRSLERKVHLINWEVVCTQKEKGGLGIRKIDLLNKALLGKWIWRFASEKNNIWKRVIGVKYGQEGFRNAMINEVWDSSLGQGGAADYPGFRGLLKQLVGPLSIQLSDRRSSIVKQTCHLLIFLSKELLGDFESCAEMFIPVLFKLVVITVLVIAESADNCIKTMLRNCKVARVLPKIADCAKNDRNAVLRARCCEYSLLILEYWADAPEIQRSADLYEDLIKCCVADAMSEVKEHQMVSTLDLRLFFFVLWFVPNNSNFKSESVWKERNRGSLAESHSSLVRLTARMCYRMFAKTWPERSRRLFVCFDPVIQRIINEEDGGMHRRHASPSLREKSSQISFTPQTSAPHLPGYGTSAIVAMDRSSSLPSGTSISSGLLLSQAKSVGKGTERSLESVLQASKQKVTAIESMLRGLELSDKHNSSLRSSSLDLGVDPPSSRDPPFPLAVPASNQLTNTSMVESNASSIVKGSNRNGGMALSDIITQIQASKDPGKLSYRSNMTSEPLSAFSSYSAKRVSERLQERGSLEDNSEIREARRYMNQQSDRQYSDTPYKDVNFRDNSYIPNFQRPLLRKNVAGRMSAGRRRSFDDNQFSLGDMSSYEDGPTSLNDALGEGLSPSSDWSARVAAFNYLRSLLHQGPKGVQEIMQSFEKVMKLFFQHLDDPHHKVAQAALSTLADIIPSCRKPFESYMERILPHVFSRLIDPKELVRQPCSTTLEIVSKTYGIDSLLPALLRSLDEQRSPKAKLAVIEFSISSFNKHALNSEGSGNSGILKLWLAKLTPLAHDKNTKLKEAAITCIISVYSHFDSIAVLNFILSLSVEEQNSLRRALKQYTPRIEVDLMNFLQSKKERQRPKSSYDPSDVVGTSSEEGYIGASKKNHFLGRYSAGSIDSDGGRKWSSAQESTLITDCVGQATSDEAQEHMYQNLETNSNTEGLSSKTKDLTYMVNSMGENIGSWSSRLDNVDSSVNFETSTPRPDINGLMSSDHTGITEGFGQDNEARPELDHNHSKAVKINSATETGPSIPQILHLICNGNDEKPTASKRGALQQLIEASVADDQAIWTKPLVWLAITMIVKGAPRLRVARRHPPAPRLRAGDAPSRRRRLGATRSTGAPRSPTSFFSFSSSSPSLLLRRRYFNQILTAILEILDDSDSSIRELALSLIVEMLKNQKGSMEDSVEIVIEKLLHVAKDIVPKVSNEAEHCLTIVLSQYDPFRCLSVIIPLLVTEDEKTLVTCINCLTKNEYLERSARLSDICYN